MAERMAFGAKDVDLESETPLCFWFRESWGYLVNRLPIWRDCFPATKYFWLL
jgi:hypothetical protein